MNDIAKCKGQDCDKKETCYRFLIRDGGKYQNWILTNNKDNKCIYYWQIKQKSKEAKNELF